MDQWLHFNHFLNINSYSYWIRWEVTCKIFQIKYGIYIYRTSLSFLHTNIIQKKELTEHKFVRTNKQELRKESKMQRTMMKWYKKYNKNKKKQKIIFLIKQMI